MSTATNEHHADHSNDDGAVHAHVSSPLFMIGIFATLIVLTIVTVAVSYVDLGSANSFVALLVATLKAGLVSTFFMHLRWDRPFHALVFIFSFVFLAIFIGFTNDDLSTRGEIDPNNGVHVLERSGAVAPGGIQVPAAPPATPGHETHEEHH